MEWEKPKKTKKEKIKDWLGSIFALSLFMLVIFSVESALSRDGLINEILFPEGFGSNHWKVHSADGVIKPLLIIGFEFGVMLSLFYPAIALEEFVSWCLEIIDEDMNYKNYWDYSYGTLACLFWMSLVYLYLRIDIPLTALILYSDFSLQLNIP